MLSQRVGVAVGVFALVVMGGLSACSAETPKDRPSSSHSVTPTEKNLSPTGGNLFAPGAPVTTTTTVTGTNSKNPPPPPPPPPVAPAPAHGSGRGAAGPGGPGGGPGGGGSGGGPH